MSGKVPEPWLSFLREVDQALEGPVEVHCLGAFALRVLSGLSHPTADIDVVEVAPRKATRHLLAIAGEGSLLWRKYRLYIDKVGVAQYPENYASRLVDITPRGLRRLRVMALEPHDVALAKLARNSPRDREDVAFLVQNGVLDAHVLRSRFETELRPHLSNPEREALTLDLWLEEFFSGNG